mgnify:CR=1 FL=1
MDTVKSCQNCEMGKVAYPNNTCQVCTSTDLSMWQPNEQTKMKYMIKLAEGSNGTTEYDVVSKPKHYMLFSCEDLPTGGYGIEVRDVINKLLDKIGDNPKGEFYSYQFAADYVQLIQYLMRFMDKNGVEDLKKARWYLDKMISAY